MTFLETTDRPERPLWPAVRRGLAGKCPSCGEGRLFGKYLKVNETCPSCGEELHHHRADDAPPYLVIVIVGHLLVAIILHVEMVYRVPASIYLWTMIPLAIGLSLWLLPIVKGAVVAMQWAKYMHGFDPRGPDDDIEDERG
ncbi:DUF983 domain-containing protein [Pelagibacterium limicola]|uniref:DUF983 domain-containing protein n=1 Tax=Pelagibacterium limicola TaxID=2791022 RepID=UPI0018AFD2F4|nr:DUF983 domain-containing protein [Pelagibacterium limicola]